MKRANFMNTPFDFMNTPYLYMNAAFLKMSVVCFYDLKCRNHKTKFQKKLFRLKIQQGGSKIEKQLLSVRFFDNAKIRQIKI